MSPTIFRVIPWITMIVASVMNVIGTVTSSPVSHGIAIVFFVITVIFSGIQIHKEIKEKKEKKELEALKKEEKSEPEGLKSEIVGVINTEE